MADAFIIDGLRTPIGRFGGVLSGVRPDDMAAMVIDGVMARQPGIDFSRTDEVILGCANQAGEDGRNVARMAVLISGLPVQVPGLTVNRLCASGLDAVAMAARQIRLGEADLIIAGGVESMSRAPMVMPKGTDPKASKAEIYDTTIGWRFINQKIDELYGSDSMPETAENLAQEHQISRTDQDAYALRSQKRTRSARKRGFFDGEILPIKTEFGLVTEDEHPRPDTSKEKLAALDTPFRKGGTVTAGNASGINDGAAALVIASDKAVKDFDLTPLARIVGAGAAGVEPRIMGLGPVPATKRLMGRLKINLADVALIELNEAFAVQVLACLRSLGLEDDAESVNPNGGAISLGHPLGMSGARLALTAARALREKSGKYALVTLCVGVGQGKAMVIERP